MTGLIPLWLNQSLAALLALATQSPAVPPITPGSAPAPIDYVTTGRETGNRMTVDVHVDSVGPFRFLIDTGAERTVISRAMVNQLGLVPDSTIRVLGLAGSVNVDMVELPSLRLGKQQFDWLQTPVLDGEHMGVDGILGLDGLQNQTVMLDFRKGLIGLEAKTGRRSSKGYEIVVSARRKSGQLIITNALIGGVKVAVVLDTGAQSSIGNPALQARLRGRMTLEGQTQLQSVTGQSLIAEFGVAREFRMGDLRFAEMPLAFADSPVFKELELTDRPALLLGMSTLSRFDRVAIDFAGKKILFDVPDQQGQYIEFGGFSGRLK